MHGWYFESKRYGLCSSIIFKGFCVFNWWGCSIVSVSQSSRAGTGELRERKVLSSTLSELVASLHERPLADINQSVTCTEWITWKYYLLTFLWSGVDNNGCYSPSTRLLWGRQPHCLRLNGGTLWAAFMALYLQSAGMPSSLKWMVGLS